MLVVVVSCLLVVVAAQQQEQLPQQKVMLPTFLKGASDDCKQQFVKIIGDTSLNRQEKDTEVEQLMESQPEDVKNAFEAYRKKVQDYAKQFAETVGDKIDAMSPAARHAANHLHFIESNQALSRQQRMDRAKAYFNSLQPDVQAEIKEMRGSLPPRLQPEMTYDH